MFIDDLFCNLLLLNIRVTLDKDVLAQALEILDIHSNTLLA